MAQNASTAEQIRKRPIYVTLPGTTLRIECRRPEPVELIASGLLKLDAFNGIIEELANQLQDIQPDAVLDNRPVVDVATTQPKTYKEFLDQWCALVAVSPKLTLKEEDAIYDPAMLWVKDLDVDVKTEIFVRTMSVMASARVLQAVRSFRLGRPDGVGPGSDGAPVRQDPVGVVGGV